MRTVTTRVDSDTYELIEQRADETDQSKSAVAREWIAEHERLSERVGELETENERLRRELAATNRRVDEHQDLVEYVEEHREVERHRNQREQRRAQASVFTRAKWWLTGMPSDTESDGQ